MTGVVVWAFARKPEGAKFRGGRNSLYTILVFWATAAFIGWLLTSTRFQQRLHHFEEQLHIIRGTPAQATGPGHTHRKAGHVAQVRWDEIAIVLALLGALGVAGFVGRRRRGVRPDWHFGSQAAVSAALDESLDDLRSDPDLRRAIVAAYARMERALAVAGLQRHPAEAPLEYMERALLSLDASADAVRRLTDLFEWARFSHHEPEPAMRDEAVDALVAVRDELRGAESVAA